MGSNGQQHLFKNPFWSWWSRKERIILERAAVSEKISEMSYLTCQMQCIHHNCKNIEIKKFNFTFTKEMQRNFWGCALGNCDTCHNGTPKKASYQNESV